MHMVIVLLLCASCPASILPSLQLILVLILHNIEKFFNTSILVCKVVKYYVCRQDSCV